MQGTLKSCRRVEGPLRGRGSSRDWGPHGPHRGQRWERAPRLLGATLPGPRFPYQQMNVTRHLLLTAYCLLTAGEPHGGGPALSGETEMAGEPEQGEEWCM